MGVGTILKRKLSWLPGGGGCKSCGKLANAMDSSGVAWCSTRREYLLDEMAKNAATLGIPFIRGAVGFLLDSAIREQQVVDADAERVAAMSFEDRVLETIRDIDAGPRAREERWNWNPESVEAVRRIINRRLDSIDLEKPPQEYDPGCGIVTLGGSLRYFPSAYVLCSLLRGVGCKLPIEVWYLGEHELDPRMACMLESLGDVTCRDATAIGGARMLGGWEAKAWAIAHSRFAEVLYLDADIVPVRDPSYLFSEPAYIERGVVSWPNFDHSISYTATAEGFTAAGLPVPGRDERKKFNHHTRPTDYRAWETGQLLVDKSRHFAAIEIAKVLGDYADFFYPRESPPNDWHTYGDTQIFPWAFARARAEVAMPFRACEMFGDANGGGLNQYDLAGELAWQHRCQPRLKIRVSSDNPPTGLERPEEFKVACGSIKTQWRAVVWDWRDQSPEELTLAQSAVGHYFAQGLTTERQRIVLADGGRIEGGRSLHWRASIRDGVERLVIAGTERAAAILMRTKRGWLDSDTGAELFHCPGPEWDGISDLAECVEWVKSTRENPHGLPDSLDGGTVVVIGAGDGAVVADCLRRGAARVVAVESRLTEFARLARNVGADPRVECLHRSVGGAGLLGVERREVLDAAGVGAIVIDAAIRS